MGGPPPPGPPTGLEGPSAQGGDFAAPRAAEAGPPPGDLPIRYSPSSTLDELLAQVQKIRASDLHVHSGARVRVRIHGRMEETSEILSPERAEELIYAILSEEQRARLEEQLQLDFAHEIPGQGRFRANAYKQQNGLDAVFRAIPPNPPTLAELGLPDDLERVVAFHQGIVLFTGPAGCGKSSTMAAMVRLLNAQRPDHILTVEDPIEYVHISDRALINQREVGPHTESFARALRAALREDPDIIAIGELRDLETIELALTAAETGHLVLGTLHTSSAIRTINRLLGVFPPEQQNQIRTMVSESLRAVVSQRLIPRADGQGRIAALEVLMSSRAIGNLIRENKTFQIPSQMQTGAAQGMKILDNSLTELVQQGLITQEEARRNAEDPKRFP
ncbi:MAG: type IV pilus twitching motility protein PilT [Holophagales bacterium]|nr:type IV pilus twitching motility protein PilT [Holophagales bacterium]